MTARTDGKNVFISNRAYKILKRQARKDEIPFKQLMDEIVKTLDISTAHAVASQ